jgi:hypothetical protein
MEEAPSFPFKCKHIKRNLEHSDLNKYYGDQSMFFTEKERAETYNKTVKGYITRIINYNPSQLRDKYRGGKSARC